MRTEWAYCSLMMPVDPSSPLHPSLLQPKMAGEGGGCFEGGFGGSCCFRAQTLYGPGVQGGWGSVLKPGR